MLDKYPKLKARVERTVRVMRDKGFTSHEGIRRMFDDDTDFEDVDGLEDVLGPIMQILMLLPEDMWKDFTGMDYYEGDEGQTRPSFDPDGV